MGIMFNYKCSGGNFARNRLFHVSLFLLLFLLFFTKDKPCLLYTSPSIGGNGNWWLGNTDTGVRAAGTTGATGAAGATGATGAPGAAGRNGTDGKDGKDGKDGVGIREAVSYPHLVQTRFI